MVAAQVPPTGQDVVARILRERPADVEVGWLVNRDDICLVTVATYESESRYFIVTDEEAATIHKWQEGLLCPTCRGAGYLERGAKQ